MVYLPFRHLSIRRKLMAMVLGISTLTLLLTSVVQFVYGFERKETTLVEQVTMAAKIIGSQSTAALQFVDAEAARENLSGAAVNDAVMLACLYDKDSKAFAVYMRGEKSGDANALELCPAAVSESYRFDRTGLHVFQPVVLDGQQIGTVYLLASLDDMISYAWRNLLWTVILMGVAIILAYFLSLRFQYLITSPVSSLVSVMTEVSNTQNYSLRAEKYYSDELGTLVDSFNDMLEQVLRRDEALISARQEAEEANKAKSEFLANMSHELRTPMHGILGCAQLSMDYVTGDKEIPRDRLMNRLQIIKESGDRLLRLLNNLLDLSKLEAGLMNFNKHSVNLRDIAARVRNSVHPLLEQKHLTLEIPSEDKPAEAYVDKDRMEQVLLNLVGNAIKFTPESKKISIAFREATMPSPSPTEDKVPAILMEVADEGVGIPEGELEKIFDKFIQSSTTKTGAGGTGLGLSICKQIIEAHGGSIWAENRKEGGTKFVCIFPRHHTAEASPQETGGG